MTAEPLVLSFDVGCPPDRAFALWTAHIGTWWPPDHTVTGRNDLAVVLEAGVGGRIFERTPDGQEHQWGEVRVWEPPHRLSYSWHLRADRSDATEVVVRFVARGQDVTRVEIEHTGWERLGTAAEERRERNRLGWESLFPYFVEATALDRTTKEQQP